MTEGRPPVAGDLWVARLSELATTQEVLDGVLSPAERDQVRRSRRTAPTARASRALLRLLLARYLDRPPASVQIERRCAECGADHGKPRLGGDHESGPAAYEVSVSHGGDLLVIAVAPGVALGVDVEAVPAPAGPAQTDISPELLDFVLTAQERDDLAATPAAERQRAFLRYWTGKEAVLKAAGTGLDVSPHTVSLPPARQLEHGPAVRVGSPAGPCWLQALEVADGYLCSLASAEPLAEVRVADLSADLAVSLAAW